MSFAPVVVSLPLVCWRFAANEAIIDIGCYECQIPAPGLMMLVK